MDLSKSGLYALIRPLPAERACPECGEGLVFSNRTTEHKAIASCLACDYVSEAGGADLDGRPTKRRVARRPRSTAVPSGEPARDLDGVDGEAALRKTTGGRSWRSNRVLWASVLLGVAAGLYVTRRVR